MALKDKNWTNISINEVVLAWLLAERHNVVRLPWHCAAILDKPDLKDTGQNRLRYRTLYAIRNLFVMEIPPDTEWYRVENLTAADLVELYLVNHPTVSDQSNTFELIPAAPQLNWALSKEPKDWEAPILWGHSKAGPFTILEANHRLAAYANTGRTDLDIPIFIGLSDTTCVHHSLDGAPVMLRDQHGH